MAMQPTIARQNGRGLWLYSYIASLPQLRFLRRKGLRRAAHCKARNTVLVPISQGTEVTIVRSLLIFHSYWVGDAVWEPVQSRRAMRGNDSKPTYVGVRPRGANRIHQAQAEPSGSSVAWVSSRIVYTWCPYNMAMPLLEWALTPMVHCKPKEEYARVIVSTKHLEILCFITGLPLTQLPKPRKSCPDLLRQNAQCIPSGHGKCGKHSDLGSERSGEHLRYITHRWFQDNLGVVRPEFQANSVDGKGL